MLTALHGFIENDLVWRDFIAGAVPVRTPLLPGHGGKPCPPESTRASVAKMPTIWCRKGIRARQTAVQIRANQAMGQTMAPASSSSLAPTFWAAKTPR